MANKRVFKVATASAVAASALVAAVPASAASVTYEQAEKQVNVAREAANGLHAEYTKNADYKTKVDIKEANDELNRAKAKIAALSDAKQKAYLSSRIQGTIDTVARANAYNNAVRVGTEILPAAHQAVVKAADVASLKEGNVLLAAKIKQAKETFPKVYGKEMQTSFATMYLTADLEADRKDGHYAAITADRVAEGLKLIAAGKVEEAEVQYKNAEASFKAVKGLATIKEIIAADWTELGKKIEAAKTPKVESVSAINATQAVVTFAGEIGDVAASNFTVDKNVTVIKAEVNASNKKEVTLTFNQSLIDNDTYKVTVDGVKSATGTTMKEAASVEFKYEIAAVKTVQLSKTKFYDGDSILDAVVVKDTNGLVLDNSTLDIEIAATDSAVNPTTGVVTTADAKSFYVEIKVKDGSEVLATTGAVKVDVAPELEVSGFEGLHIGSLTSGSEVTDYETAKKSGELVSSLKVNEDGAVLNLFAKDVDGNIVLLSPVASPLNYKITNLTPTVANVNVVGGQFVINTITTGKAQAKIKVGDLETTVSFDVKANEKIADATLGSNKVSLDTSANGLASSETVSLSLKDQYANAIVYPANVTTSNDTTSVVTYDDGSKLSVKSGNTRVAEATVAADGDVTIALPAQNGVKGSTTVTVEYKDASGKVVFTKSIAVTASDFDSAIAKYDLVLSSQNSVLDADNDANETGVDLDDEVTFVLKQLDKYGNVIGTETLDGSTASITATTSNSKDQGFLDTVAYGTGTGTVALTSDAVLKLVNSGTVKITATVGGVTVDTLDVSYKNTDSVVTKAAVNTSSRTVDLSVLGGTTVSVEELLFGKLNNAGTKYALNPVLTVQDQFGKTMTYDIANGLDLLKNGLQVVPATPVVTNLNNVTEASGNLSLTDDTKAGSVTIVVPAVSTSANADLLAAPVSITVTLVK
ncbi:hypothetical protein ABE65_018375 [Fictibacillus phosphorivorans]|uniref:SbsC C-terminal domain-containing protein n=1 Tax=Fictibacillus phosphorivorans TaxID=1221500 RepID=A0A168W957_9BACL|nr:hypothetical protein [Fictibacillus phosphorivorans]ANC78655.1 hypothetical protein ABE65_018375 [Fictibacillus phosphorivorans]